MTIYRANTDGTHVGVPCPVCGCIVVLLDPTPQCIRCLKTTDRAGAAAEAVLGGLNELLDLVDQLPSTTRLILNADLDAARETIDTITVALELAS